MFGIVFRILFHVLAPVLFGRKRFKTHASRKPRQCDEQGRQDSQMPMTEAELRSGVRSKARASASRVHSRACVRACFGALAGTRARALLALVRRTFP